MLVLLIIFMVTAPMMQQGVDVDLPETTTQNLRMREEPLIITVKKGGKVLPGRIPRSPRRSSGRSFRRFSTGLDDKERLPASRSERGNYGAVVKALAAARAAGATKLGMVTEPE